MTKWISKAKDPLLKPALTACDFFRSENDRECEKLVKLERYSIHSHDVLVSYPQWVSKSKFWTTRDESKRDRQREREKESEEKNTMQI